MKKIPLIFGSFILFLVWVPAYGQDCSCHALLPVKLQPRGLEKNKLEDSLIREVNHVITVADIYGWQSQYENLTKTISWQPGNSKSKRKANTPEDSLYTVKGYLWFVHQIGFDCDYHIEIGEKDSASIRIIIEVPHTNHSVQKKIKQHLDSLGLSILGCTTKSTSKAHYNKGIPVLVNGYGFYDAFHKVNRSHGDKHTNRYLWEIHPVTGIIFLPKD